MRELNRKDMYVCVSVSVRKRKRKREREKKKIHEGEYFRNLY